MMVALTYIIDHHYIQSTLVPEAFIYSLLGIFFDANRFYYFCYRHEAVRALKASGRDR